MRRAMIAAIAAVGMMASHGALAQSVAVEISPEQRTVIREYVMQKRVEPVQISSEVRVGAVLPVEVELYAVPADWGPALARYRYIYWNDQVVLVEPASRKVVEIIN